MGRLQRSLLKSVLALTSLICFLVFLKSLVTVFKLYQDYLYFAIGGVVYLVLSRIAKKNIDFFQTFSHEVAHMIIGLLFGKKIESFYVGNGDGGWIKLRGKLNIFIILAPYCLTYFTFLLLILPLITPMPEWYMIFVGMSFFFYLHTFKRQTRRDQTDIQRNGVVLSMLFIATFLFFNLSVCVYSVSSDLLIAFKTVSMDIYNFILFIYFSISEFVSKWLFA